MRVASLDRSDGVKKEADAKLGGGDLDGALGLYGACLEVEPDFVSALSNRAACLLALGRFADAAADCSAALDLLAGDPKVAAATNDALLAGMGLPTFGAGSGGGVAAGPIPPVGSAKRRLWVLKTVARRGLARAKLGRFQDAIDDYRTAVDLDPADDALKADLAALEAQHADATASAARTAAANAVTVLQVEPHAAALQHEAIAADSARERSLKELPPPAPEEAGADLALDAAGLESHAKFGMEAVPGLGTRRSTMVAGAGSAVEAGGRVTVHASGRLRPPNDLHGSGPVFWDTRTPGQLPFTYKAGVGQVIEGWDHGCLGMREGETRLLHIPAAEGYGAAGFPAWGIPPHADLTFTLDCLKVVAEC
jgi:U3 small nucleolar RNA-associated protein 21